MNGFPKSATAVLEPSSGLAALVEVLGESGYAVVGPVARDGVISYDTVHDGADLPTGVRTEQSPGRFRLTTDGGPTRFGWIPAADSWRRWFFPPEEELLRIRRTDGSFVVTHPAPPAQPLALIGARDCEVRGLAVLDRVLLDGEHPDPRYAARREGAFIVAVTCGEPADTCWCTSAGGGPRPAAGFDIRLTEVTGGAHRLVAEAGTTRGADVLAAVAERCAAPSAGERDVADAAEVAHQAADRIRRPVDASALPDLLAGTDLHPHWDDVASRCLSCANCTLVCPTCFCVAIDDVTPLTDDGSPAMESVRRQQWASCFQLDHSNLGGRPVRSTTASRYRQWLTHKLSTWQAQFGTSGCVGCGRCTTWCPAGIDLPVEAALLAVPSEGDAV